MICQPCATAADAFMPHIGCQIGCPCRHRGQCGDRHVCSPGCGSYSEFSSREVFFCNRGTGHPKMHLYGDGDVTNEHIWEASC